MRKRPGQGRACGLHRQDLGSPCTYHDLGVSCTHHHLGASPIAPLVGLGSGDGVTGWEWERIPILRNQVYLAIMGTLQTLRPLGWVIPIRAGRGGDLDIVTQPCAGHTLTRSRAFGPLLLSSKPPPTAPNSVPLFSLPPFPSP